MALVVETGSIVSGAESYVSVTDADTYFSNRNLTLWASGDFSTAEKEACLRRATDYMRQMYRMLWAGYRKSDDQALDWPRYEVPKRDSVSAGFVFYSDTTVPQEVKDACCELAWRAAFGELSADQSTPVTEKTVGPITIKYAEGARQSKRYTAVDAILAPVLKNGHGSSATVVRA